MKKITLLIVSIFILLYMATFLKKLSTKKEFSSKSPTWWNVQSIDTMKYSRDLTAEKISDLAFNTVIEQQIKNIANTGATHVAIATPYDEKFIPMLTRWVTIARKYNLKIWFRGNFSGWEKWFNFERISREEHAILTKNFILNHKNLFEDGDYFTACPECENGGPGDPRQTGDAIGHRLFLIQEYEIANSAFLKIGKNVSPALHSMNYDVAKLIMDKPTTKALGGVVAIDHYVNSPTKLASDIRDIAKRSGGKVFLGEFGAPIPDIHGKFTDEQQASWIQALLENLVDEQSLIGVNYWVNVGGSTELWSNTTAKPAVAALTSFFSPSNIKASVVDQFGLPVENAQVKTQHRETSTNTHGQFIIPIHPLDKTLLITTPGYPELSMDINRLHKNATITIHKPLNSIFKSILNYIWNRIHSASI